MNKNIADVASDMGIGYFDLTEDVSTTEYVKSKKSKKKDHAEKPARSLTQAGRNALKRQQQSLSHDLEHQNLSLVLQTPEQHLQLLLGTLLGTSVPFSLSSSVCRRRFASL